MPSGGPVPKLVRLVQLDGKLPNLALMKLAHWHRQQGWDVQFTRHVDRGILDREPDAVYGSCIFKYSRQHLTRFVKEWPQAVVGGTGSDSLLNVEHLIGQHEHYDYSIYPGYLPSIGFTQRGCRLKCGFCVVPQKEGRPIPVNSIRDIWRGEPYPKDVVLLDNDFFGQPPEEWKARVNELIDGQFRVSFNQGLNVRLIHEEGAHWLGRVRYYDDQFKERRLYTAWDNLGDEAIFFRGVDMLLKAGVRPRHLLVYMLIGYDPKETWEQRLYRVRRMQERGLLPFPMVYENRDPELKRFQRWVVRGYYRFIPWEKYTDEGRRASRRAAAHPEHPGQGALL